MSFNPDQHVFTKSPDCPYCQVPSVLISGKEIYPHRKDLFKKLFYACKDCSAYVGCHPRTRVPLGLPAKEGLRGLRSAVHKAFDSIWLSGQMSRTEAYELLAKEMGKTKDETHVGLFFEKDCELAMEVSKKIKEQQ